MNRGYPTNLTDNQWQILQKILEPKTRKRKYSLRDIMDCILYINKTGCQWRMVPKDFPPYNLVFYYFTKWRREGVFEDIMDTLREKLRVALGREESPSLGIIDSRSAKTTQHVDKERGIDGNKKIKGRKDQVVDAYPVLLKFKDVLLIFATILAVGCTSAFLTVRHAMRKSFKI